jgi:hypothetical protein
VRRKISLVLAAMLRKVLCSDDDDDGDDRHQYVRQTLAYYKIYMPRRVCVGFVGNKITVKEMFV